VSQLIATPALEPAAAATRPLCVDLDGTLVKSDTLVDSLLVLARSRPALLFRLPAQLLRGKAALKAFVAESVSLDARHLPYNCTLLRFLEQEHAQGREIYLATGADEQLARRVADHLGIFAGVMGSDGATNLTGARKLDRMRSHLGTRLGESGFDYIGNDLPDVPLLSAASQAMVANPSAGLQARLKAHGIQPHTSFIECEPRFKSLVSAVRVHQWAKNLLVFVPVFLSHALATGKLLAALGAFCCFSLTASATYIFNDLLDIEADRRHAHKRLRPFASGDLQGVTGIAISACFLAAGLAGAVLLPGHFMAWLLVYLAASFAYTGVLKRIPLVDVLALSGMYILRLLAGGAVTDTPISPWLAGFSLFLFLSLAIVKRFAELEKLRASGSAPENGRGYEIADLAQLRSFGTASAYAAAVVFAIYISGPDVEKLYHHPNFLWLSVPLIILWLNRVWLLAGRGELNEDPVAFALTDRISVAIGAAVVIVAALAV
jgi:4-hydroxybenzoate polyprenyltransferase/phosphoserine phosphatase